MESLFRVVRIEFRGPHMIAESLSHLLVVLRREPRAVIRAGEDVETGLGRPVQHRLELAVVRFNRIQTGANTAVVWG
ncbi:MAG: hypothetical protein BGO00_08070 [Alphaproteobacteria bacterium 62-8]|nr:MAG: hypothetical protein BGO00_08070 [Alphaproteobacteria bacterium 62-8]